MHVIAVDLGAFSGRVMKVSFDGESFTLDAVHRFNNEPVDSGKALRWNVKRLWRETVKGIQWAQEGASSIGIASWGVDYGLLDKEGNLIEDPFHYRDPRTSGMMDWVFKKVPRKTIFQRTGVQFLELNTLYQIASQVKTRRKALRTAETYLGFPDLFNYWLTSEKKAEFTHATTTQMYSPVDRDWCYDIMEAVGIPSHIFPDVIQPGTVIGDCSGVPLCAPACHDTGSAIAAIPSTSPNFAYISSGTWSLIGAEMKEPLINDEVYSHNFTNEGGVEGTFRLLKNLPGLWLEQELTREWTNKGAVLSYGELEEAADKSQPFRSIIDPSDPVFHSPGEMTTRIQQYCSETGQEVPRSIGEYMRCIYESLALNYRHALGGLVKLTGRQPDVIHVIGGGSKNKVLNRMTADALGVKVVAGPGEATTIGNALVQYISLGMIRDISEGRRILSESLELETFTPGQTGGWDEAYRRFEDLLGEET
ncbi:MAG: rhamnulokinase [Candidatus Bathyarchaeota archaeon]|nr:rhamnulokinase [Candidatus Bathyarchaeota archaeon]